MSKELMSALEQALRDNPQLKEQPTEDISEELVRGGYLQQEPSPDKVAEALGTVEMRKRYSEPGGDGG